MSRFALLIQLPLELISYSHLSWSYLYQCSSWSRCHSVATLQIHTAHSEYCWLQMLPLHWQTQASHQIHHCNLHTVICLWLQSTLLWDRVKQRKHLLKGQDEFRKYNLALGIMKKLLKDPRQGYQGLPWLHTEVIDPVHRTNCNDAEVILLRSR